MSAGWQPARALATAAARCERGSWPPAWLINTLRCKPSSAESRRHPFFCRAAQGAQQVLAYLGRYTHRVAISNQRLVSMNDDSVAFQWKDYRNKGSQESKTMTLQAGEFIRRLLSHTLPSGFQRIRHYGFLANVHRRAKLELCRRLLTVPVTELLPTPTDCQQLLQAITEHTVRCPECGVGTMVRIAVLPDYRWPALPPNTS